jgi:hypothetical protein
MPDRKLALDTLDGDRMRTNIRAIWRWSIVFVVLSDLVEVILVQLSDEASKIAMLEVFGEDQLGEFLVLHLMLLYCGQDVLRLLHTSRTTKLSPPSPHLTMDSYDGSSNIL